MGMGIISVRLPPGHAAPAEMAVHDAVEAVPLRMAAQQGAGEVGEAAHLLSGFCF